MTAPRVTLKESTSTKTKEVDTSKLCMRLENSAKKVVSFFEEKLRKDGSYGVEAKELACYFKSPMLFLEANKPHSAEIILNYIQAEFMSTEGDFRTSPNTKSVNGAYIEYWSYTNGWIIRAANRLGRTDITHPAYNYLQAYNLGEDAGFLTNDVKTQTGVTDVLTTAHHGLINLEMGNMDVAMSAGNYLCRAISKQPNLAQGFYLRFDEKGEVITQFPQEKTIFNFVSTIEPNQLHFMIGYPAAYLAMLYDKTKNEDFLNASKAYLDFSLSCNEQIYQCNFSHKTAWAASLIYACTGEKKYLHIIERISDYFIANQSKNGMWFSDDINSSYDQSAEIACWFLDIVKNINYGLKKTISIGDAKQTEPAQHQSWTTQAMKYGVMALVAGLGVYSFCRSRTNGATASCDAVANVIKSNGI